MQMADYREIFRTEETQNWFKCSLALHITREGILEFVEYEINRFHQYILSILPSRLACNTCTTQSVVPCPAKGVCKIGRGGKCLNFHRVLPTGCPKNVCDRIFREIELAHKHQGPSWKNTDASRWCSNHWEIAKCFCPPDGYSHISNSKETDFNGLISVMQNCIRFCSLLSPTGEAAVEKARDVGRNIRHSPDLKINSQTTSDYIDALIALLNGGQCLSQMPKAADGRLQLDKLKNDTLTITNQDIKMIVAEAYEETIRDKLNSTLEKKLVSLQEITHQIESRVTCLEVTSENQDRRVAAVENTLLHQGQRIFQLELGANQDNYQVLKEELQKDLVEYYTVKKSTMLLSPAYPGLDEEVERFYVQPKLTVVQVRKKINDSTNIMGKEILTYKDLFEIGNLKNIYIQGNPGMGKSTFSIKLTLDWCNCIIARGAVQDNQKDANIKILDFDFLFLISLREGNDSACGVLEMVKGAVISHLSFELKYNDEFLSKVLDRERCLIILDGLDEWTHPKNESCRMSPNHIPHRSALGKCVYLTLTRPWKLSQICLKDSEIDVMLEISGVRDQNELVIKVLSSLNRNKEISKDVNKFITATENLSGLKTIPVITIQLICIWHESEKIPSSQSGIYCEMMKMMLDRKNSDEVSSTKILTVDMPKCFHSAEWFESEKQILVNLGELAFETLFPEDGHSSHVVFTRETVSHYLEQEMKTTALSVGLLTEYKIRSLNQKRSQLSFLHKTFQEFLAAFYLSLNADQNKELVSRVNIQGENINDISQLFVFLCAMVPTLATPVSKVLMEVTTRSLKNRHYDILRNASDKNEITTEFYKNIVKNVTEIINSGYKECVQNGHDNACLEMSHIYFDRKGDKVYQPEEKLLQQNVKKIETIWCHHPDFYQKALIILNSSSVTLTTLCLPYVDNSADLNMCRNLQAFTISHIACTEFRPAVCLDMSRCKLLEHLDIKQHSLVLNINTDQLHYCYLVWCDLSQSNIVETITKRNSKLRYFDLVDCRFPRVKSGDRSFHLDISSCSSLEWLVISNCDISVSINTTILRVFLWDIDLSQGNLLEALNNSTQLKSLELVGCCFGKIERRQENKVLIDISACTNLLLILVMDSDVIVKYNNVVVGRDETLWRKMNDSQH